MADDTKPNILIRFIQAIEERMARGNWFRRGYVIAVTWLSWDTIKWSMHFAEASQRPGSDIAMIIGAIAATVAAIQGFAFKQYIETGYQTGESPASQPSYNYMPQSAPTPYVPAVTMIPYPSQTTYPNTPPPLSPNGMPMPKAYPEG